MLGKTSMLAIRTLIHLGRGEPALSVPPKRIAEALGESPTYLAKVARLLVRAGILRAEKGVKGGVRLSRPPSQITLLSIVEASQGAIVGDYCEETTPGETACRFHEAAAELHRAITGVLSRWTLAELLAPPNHTNSDCDHAACLLRPLQERQPRCR